LSDIHGNLEALDAVLADISGAACDEVWCLGDIVGYGADPSGSVARIRESTDVSLLGNHDAVAAGLHDDAGFNELAQNAIRWTQRALSADDVTYLRQLPLVHRAHGVLAAHAHPTEPDGWAYLFPGQDVAEVFAESTHRVMLVGHSHCPGVANDGEHVIAHLGQGKVALETDHRYLVNVGSVGQPRDQDPRAAWGLLDLDANTYEQRRVEYDLATAQQKILTHGLPSLLAERLAKGL
jgi:diadenosine tetraphosphatase ApaH/serine/threonine PP2A family protein phosphatase